MATIEKRIDDLENAIQPAGRVWAAWPTDNPELYELLQTDEILTLAAIRARLTPADTLLIVKFDRRVNQAASLMTISDFESEVENG